VLALPPAAGARAVALLRGTVRARGPPLVCAAAADIPRLRASVDGVEAFLARDLVALPYQVFAVRSRGADAFVLQAAVWPIADVGYQCKLARVLSMACVVEAHTARQVEQLLAARPAAAALLLCARDADTLGGDAGSFEALYAPFADRLREWGLPLVAEAAAGVAPEDAAAACPNADAVLCDMPAIS
jgi:indole-3-glycerol phosphate synthase